MNCLAVIEIPQGSVIKYEQDKLDGSLVVDRLLNQPIPYNYGYIPNTLCGDGDPLDIFILGNVPLYPLCKVKVNILAVLICTDNGLSDDKLIGVIAGDNTGAEHMGTDIIRTYLKSYKAGFEILAVGNRERATEVFFQAQLR